MGSTRNPIPILHNTAMFASNAFLPASSDISLTLGRKNGVCFLSGKKNRDFETKGLSYLCPPRKVTTGMGRERELTERDGSSKHSRNYSQELRERTSLKRSGQNSKICTRRGLSPPSLTQTSVVTRARVCLFVGLLECLLE